MSEDYDKLASEYNTFSTDSVLIMAVNCEDEIDLCKANEIRKYPTLKYFVDSVEYGYDGGRDYSSMKELVVNTLAGKTCDINNVIDCKPRSLKYIEKMKVSSFSRKVEEKERLVGISGGIMNPDLKNWVDERISILKQMVDGYNRH